MIRIVRDRRGASAVEFALLAPVLITFLFLIIEGSRLMWLQQLIDEAAVGAARCMALNSTTCQTETAIKSFAVNRAQGSGVTITAQQVTVTTNATCHGLAGFARVAISVPYVSPVAGFLPSGLATISTQACFPVAS